MKTYHLKYFYLIFVIISLCFTKCINLQCDKTNVDGNFDCIPEGNSNKHECERRNCCWNSSYTPSCFYPKDFPSYHVTSKQFTNNMTSYFLQKPNSTFRPNEILKLKANLIQVSKTILRVQITDPNSSRYQVPLPESTQEVLNEDPEYSIEITESPFSIKVSRKSTETILFDTSIAPLIYADQFIQFSTVLPNKIFYGLGEHQASLALRANRSTYTFWNRDHPPKNNINLYGSHPFYMSLDKNGDSMGFFLLNSNGMDINVNPNPALTFITIGGIIDFYIYLGPGASEVVSQHTQVIGRPQFPQYFTLGFHLCRWGYSSSEKLMEVIKRNRNIGIPYDVQWTDIDAMEDKHDWTYDEAKFKNLTEIVRDLHQHDQYYINIIDPGIKNKKGYNPYDSGVKYNVFIKHFNKSENLVGVVWPGTTVFPDFTHPNTTQWWSEQAKKFHSVIPYDGLWIDMNEPSNFLDGSTHGCTFNSYDHPPYLPKILGSTLYTRTICPSSQQYFSNHYNLHNMYGHFEAKTSYDALKRIFPNKRPFVLTRSSFAGTGSYAAHWSGDNSATWDDLYYSIPNMLSFNMFGLPQVGSDICGFTGTTTEELCIRWMQLGSFYPFMRNHNYFLSKDQDPAVFNKQAQEIMKDVLFMRYSLLPYFYYLFYRSSQFGETVVRPLFFEFQKDGQTHEIDRQFMLGQSILVTPVLDKGARTVDAYFPNETWYSFKNGEKIFGKGKYLLLEAPITDINFHIRGGSIIPIQNPSVTTKQSRKNVFGLIVGLKQGESFGSLFWDDGESLDSIEKQRFNLFNFIVKENSLKIDKIVHGYEDKMILGNLTVYGVDKNVNKVSINGDEYNNFQYDQKYNRLKVDSFQVDLLTNDTIRITWN